MSYKIITFFKVEDFIESLDNIRKARIDRIYYLFEEYGRFLPSKYLKKIAKDVWELRPGDVRLFLTIRGNKGYVVHGICKKSQKISKKDLEVAIRRIKILKEEEVG